MSNLDELKSLLTDFKNELIEIRQNTTVIAARLDAIEPEVTNNAIVMTTVANQVLELHAKMIKESERVGRHFQRLELVGSNGNGHLEIEEEDDRGV